MKNKRLSAMVIAAALAAAMTGCGNAANMVGKDQTATEKPAESAPEEAVAKTEENTQVQAGDATETKETGQTGETVQETRDPRELYQSFLDGNAKVIASGVTGVEEGEYTLDDLTESMGAYYLTDYLPPYITGASYAYIDCANDGNEELLLYLHYDDMNEWASPREDYLVIKDFDGELRVCKDAYSYYRTSSTVNRYGYITSGGGVSAASYYFDASVVNAAGEDVLIYADNCHMSLPNTMIPVDALNSHLGELIGDSSDRYEDGKYDMDCYVFTREDPDMYYAEDWDSAYEERLKEGYYTFTDMQGNPVMPDDDYVEKCKEYGINIVSRETVDAMINEAFEAQGFTEEMITDGEVVEMTDLPQYSKERITEEEADKITELCNSFEWYGFLQSSYKDPSEIKWDEVLYNGADVDSEMDDAEYNDIIATYGDFDCGITKIKAADVENFVMAKTNTSYSQAKRPLSFVYSDKYDAYYHFHGDTNYRNGYKVAGGFRNGDMVSVLVRCGYDSETDTFMEKEAYLLTLQDSPDGGYYIVSNKYMWETDMMQSISIFDAQFDGTPEPVNFVAYCVPYGVEYYYDIIYKNEIIGSMYLYDEDDGFEASTYQDVKGCRLADYDGDGDLDFIVLFEDDHGPVVNLFKNQTESGAVIDGWFERDYDNYGPINQKVKADYTESFTIDDVLLYF